MPEKTTQDPFTYDGETIALHLRLQRALADPELMDEFLTNPKKVAKQYEVTLTDTEITAIQNMGRFLAKWELLCGEGQWMDAALSDRRRARPSATSLPELAARLVRERIAAEIVQDIPEAIHSVVSRVGSWTLSDPQESLDELPEHIRPLARAIRRLERSMSRELAQGLEAATFARGPAYGTPWPGLHAPPMGPQPHTAMPVGSSQGNGVENLSAALAARANDLVSRAVTEAVAQVRPGITQPFPAQMQRRRTEQPTA